MTGERHLARPAANVVWVLAVGIPAGMLALIVAGPTPEQDAWAIPLYAGIVATWGLMGALLVTRRPDNRVGWVLLAVGLGIGLALLGQLWGYLSFASFEGSLPGTEAGLILGLLFNPSFFLVMLVPLLFPDGRLMSRRWTVVAALLLLSAAATLIGVVTKPGPIEGMPAFDNPLGMRTLGGLPQALIDIGGIGALVCIPAGIVAAVVRYRRGTMVERKQLKWFGSVLVLAFAMFFAATLLPQPYGQWAWIVASASLALVPVAIGIAILRYRLYEIDRIVSRTIGWALVSSLLLVVFAGTIVGLQALLAPFTNNNTLAVAGSTLVAAALFQPVRARVQRAVDRRFNRARVDAQQSIDAFGAHLRDDVDLAALHGRLITAADATVQPNGAGLWIRRTGS
jgi:hypothetical protein